MLLTFIEREKELNEMNRRKKGASFPNFLAVIKGNIF